ncbi:hypothetical protein [Streptomyces sp. NPDC005407]|uniref:ParB/RepB/Spo0J family partition protein n=1 Tax=Streptomyces sp. NPDC005407 TaxID=3155340 RepID=UPI0033B2F0CF
MGSRNDFDDFLGDEDETVIADTRADGRLYRVPLTRLAPNLVNPRKDFGTEGDLIDFGKSLARRQNQPCPVVSRAAYLKLWTGHGDRLGDVDYVLVSGERRYRAATAVGMPALDCVANDDFARDRKTFMEAVVSENVDRQNFDPIEEAYAVEALVREFGSNRAVAQHFERVDGWVTQRILLTHLAPDLQRLVRAKAMPLEAGRTLGKLARDNAWAADRQTAWWEQEQRGRQEKAAARKEAKRAAPPRTRPEQFPEVRQEPQPAPRQPESFTAVKQESSPAVPPPVPVVPEPRETLPAPQHPASVQPPQVKMPWHDGEACADIAVSKMDGVQLVRMMDRLREHSEAAASAG